MEKLKVNDIIEIKEKVKSKKTPFINSNEIYTKGKRVIQAKIIKINYGTTNTVYHLEVLSCSGFKPLKPGEKFRKKEVDLLLSLSDDCVKRFNL